ncbi:MAG: CDP-glucose 4,6-dehydratase [Croceibacterium sp.]
MNGLESYREKTVFITGHTGFKGSWLCLWLEQLGARVVGYSLPPPTSPSLFQQANIARGIEHHVGDVRDADALTTALVTAQPDYVFHLAAQPLVLDSYAAPAETFAINVTGSINLMEGLRRLSRPAAVVMVTTDKVYLNREWNYAYREDDPLGGHDPYSASKAAMEVAVASWRASFFSAANSAVRMASARAGNVIGGGDWSANRIVPDLVRALQSNVRPVLRNPGSLRPWQHVLEPLAGYLLLGARLAGEGGRAFTGAWNFGPLPTDVRSVGGLAEAFLMHSGRPGWDDASGGAALHEATLLRLAIDKSAALLGWRPAWDFDQTVAHTAGWYAAVGAGQTAREACLADLADYGAVAGIG